MHFNNSAALALLALVVPALCTPTGLITVEKVNGETSGRHIVTLKKGVNKADFISEVKTFNVTHKWDIINGFAGHCDDPTLDYLRAHSDVESIAEDGIVKLSSVVTQKNAPWGLQRISQYEPVGSTKASSLTFSYSYDASAGKGVDIYILDTGIYTAHVSFQGRAKWGNAFGGYERLDRNGHGTHCAAIAASFGYGVAKAANLIAVKVFRDDGNAQAADIISGLNWVKTEAATSRRPSVASVSFGGPPSIPMDNAVDALTNQGVHVVVAAGNNAVDTSNISPGRASTAFTVAASDISDNFASFSNYGAPIKMIAPGVDIVSAWIGSHTATKSISGTSAAAAHVAGLVAYFIGFYGDVAPEDLIIQIQDRSIRDKLHKVPAKTGNLLAQNTY